MNTSDVIKERLQRLRPSYLEVIDDSAAHQGHVHEGAGHYTLLINSPLFENQALVKQHQMIYAALGDLLPHSIHALSIKIKV